MPDYSNITAISLAAFATERSICRKSKIPPPARLAASKLRLKLGGWPDIREPLPPKARWKHKKHYQKLRKQVQALEAQANQTRFRKQIDIRTFLEGSVFALRFGNDRGELFSVDDRKCRKSCTAHDAKLGEDVVEVNLHGAFGYIEITGDMFVGTSGPERNNNLPLA
jgi:hypothetical protein